MLRDLFAPYADLPDHQMEVCCIWPDKGAGKAPVARHITVAEIDQSAAWLTGQGADGWGLYVGAGLRHNAPARSRASKTHVVQSRWLWLDFDAEGAADAAQTKLAAIDFLPTFWVRTGTAPFERWHAWWHLSDALTGTDAEATMRRMIAALDADPAPKSRSGLMRLAGGVAWPKPDKPGRVVEMVTRHDGTGRTYGTAEVAALVDVLDPPKPKATSKAKQTGRAAAASRASSEQIAELLRWIDPDSDYQTWLHVGFALHAAGEPIDTWDSWSSRGAKYDPNVIESKWRGFGNTANGVTIGTLYHLAGKAGADLGQIARMATPEARQRPAEGRVDLSVAQARHQLRAVVRGFWKRRQAGTGDRVELVNATLGLGKTMATLEMVKDAIEERRKAGDADAVVTIATPMHRLNDQLARDFAEVAPDLSVAVLRGPESDDPDKPGERLCKKLDEYREAASLLLDPESEVCRTCEHRASCRVLKDKLVKADCYVVAHQALAGRPPHERAGPPAWWLNEYQGLKDKRAGADDAAKAALAALADRRKAALEGQSGKERKALVARFKAERAAILAKPQAVRTDLAKERGEIQRPREGQHLLFTVVDEDPTGALMFGADLPRVMGVDAWSRAPDAGDEELKAARKWLGRVVESNGLGPLKRSALIPKNTGTLDADTVMNLAIGGGKAHTDAGAKLEWHRKVAKSEGADQLAHNKTVRTTAGIFREIGDFLRQGDDATGRVVVVEDAEKGLALRHCGMRTVQDGWKAGGLLMLDATGRKEVVEAVLGESVMVHHVEAEQPMLHLMQDTSRAFGKSMFVPGGRSPAADKAAAGNVAKLAAWVKVKAAEVAPRQLGLITYKAAVEALEDDLPSNVVCGWFGGLRGMNAMQDVAGLVVVGRPMPEEHGLRRMAAALTGREVVGRYDLGGQAERLVRASGGLWWRSGVAARHDDDMAQTLLEMVRDGEVTQAVGRVRAVNRKEPVEVWLLSDAVTPFPVDESALWDAAQDAKRDPIAMQLAAGGIAFTSPAACAAVYPHIWKSKQAAAKILTRQLSLYRGDSIRKVDASNLTALDYRIPRQPVATAWVDTDRHADPVAALLAVIPHAKDVRVQDAAPEPPEQRPEAQPPAHLKSGKSPPHAAESFDLVAHRATIRALAARLVARGLVPERKAAAAPP